ncbi:MAG: hypothetical protein PHI16_06025, partial [Methanocellales archaeon]|nr:hypothetical protein [Methanocellales archaeon]
MKNKITATLLVTLMVLSMFAAFVTPAVAAVVTSPPNGSIVYVGEDVSISVTAPEVGPVTVQGPFKTNLCTEYVEGKAVVSRSFTPPATWYTKNEDGGYYKVADVVTGASSILYLSPASISLQIDDLTTNTRDVTSIYRNDMIAINGTSNLEGYTVAIQVYDGLSPIGAQMTVTVQNGKFSVTTFDSDITEKSYTLEAKVVLANSDAIATKSFNVLSKTLTLSAPSTVVEGNEITITGTATAAPTVTVDPAKGTLQTVYYNSVTKGYSVKWSTQNVVDANVAATGNYEIKAVIAGTTLEQKATITVIGATLTAQAKDTVLLLKTDITGASNRQKDTPVFIEVTYPNGTAKFNNANVTTVEADGSYKWTIQGTYLTEKGTYKVRTWTDLGRKWYADAAASFAVSDQQVTVTLPSKVTVLNEFTVTGTANQDVGTNILLFKDTPSVGYNTGSATYITSATLDSSKAFSKKISAPAITGSYKITAVLDTDNDGIYDTDEAKASANI